MSDKAGICVTVIICLTLLGVAALGRSCEADRQQALVECIKKTDKPRDCHYVLGK